MRGHGTKFMSKSEFYKFGTIILFSLFIVLTSYGVFKLYEDHFRYHINVKFLESGPLYKDMPVCFKGYRIGYTQKVILNADYKYTMVKIAIYPKNPKFPKDIEGVVKKHDFLGNYIDLIPPEEPSENLLKDGDTIDGKPLFDAGTFLSDIADSGLLIPLIQNFSDAAVSLSTTSTKIGDFFSDSRTLIKDNRQNLKRTTESLNKITSNFNTSFSKAKLNKTTSSVETSANNIQEVTENVKNITRSVDCATRNLDTTMEKLDSTISNANAVASNAKFITCGFCEVLSKRFAGLRIIFGKPLKHKCPQ